MVNSEKIKDRLKELGYTQADLAEHLSIKAPTANQKINNVRPFDLSEAEKTAEFLKISSSDFGTYFFAG